MRWILALALVLMVVVGWTVRVAMHRHRRAPPIEPAEADQEPVSPPRTVPPERWSLGPSPRGHAGVAHITGRATPPKADEDADLSELDVVADDGARTFKARVSSGGQFALHLPPGRYTLTASVGDLVGALFNVAVAGGAERDVVIPLGPGATISGALVGAADGEIAIKATVAGGAGEAGEGTTGDGSFKVAGLVPGRRYDLTFSGPKVRTATLRAVLAPAEDQQVVLEPLAVLHGAIGFPRGEGCPIYDVRLATGVAGKASDDEGEGDDDDAPSMSPGPDCRFELAVPEGVSTATVVARGNGWFLEQQVEIPVRGDPAPLCLNPPCRDDPTDGLAALRVSLEGSDASPVTVEVTYGDDESGGRMSSCTGSRGGCRLDKLPVGESLAVQASSDHCRGETRTVALGPGETALSLPCQRLRRVEGVVRISDGALPDAITVRCAGGGSHAFHHSRLFELMCATDDADLEVQIGWSGPWQVVAIPVTGDPAFVEIGL